ncbi:unnamed protein product [Peniophora sp. CBMAI 1063]|nr:unnamed protein product [Peniophora sp. CBMAI 1063]
MSTPVLALAVTAVAAPIISISALPPSPDSNGTNINNGSSTDTSTRSYPLSAVAPFNFLLLTPIFGLISLGLGVLVGMLLYRRCMRRGRAKETSNAGGGEEYSIGSRLFRHGEDGGFVVGTNSEGDSQTPTSEKAETSTLLARHKSKKASGSKQGGPPVYDQDDAWDASDIKTPLLTGATFASSSSSQSQSESYCEEETTLHAVGAASPAMIDTHSAALWLAATRGHSLPGGRDLVISRPVSKSGTVLARSTSGSSYAPTPRLFEGVEDVPEPPFDYEIAGLYEGEEGFAR